MPTYMFSLPAAAAGHTIQIHNSAGTVVDSGVLSVASTDAAGNLAFETSQDEGYYYATGTQAPWTGTYSPSAVLDVPGSIEAGGGGGTPTADTAFLIATGTIASDNTLHDLSLAWDTRFPQVTWLTDNEDGSFTIPSGALKCTPGGIGRAAFNFTATTAPDAPSGEAFANTKLLADGVDVVATGTIDDASLTGQDLVTISASEALDTNNPVTFAPGVVLTAVASAGAVESDGSTPITDAVVTMTYAVTITRGGSAPTLP